MQRKPVAAGEFYSADTSILKDFIEKNKFGGDKKDFRGLIVPNGYYSFCGDELVKTLSAVKLPERVILLGVNHSGFGEDISVWTEGAWTTPFGDLETDEITAEEIIRCSMAKSDVLGHVREYSIENILPVLKYLKPDIKIIPISLSGMPISKLRAFANDISKFVLNGAGLIACSLTVTGGDLQSAARYDDVIIDAILSVDGEALYDMVMDRGVEMEGVYPVSVCLMSCYLARAGVSELIGRKPGAAGVVIY